MILVKHENYDDYVDAQIKRSKSRTNFGRRFIQWAQEEMLIESNRVIHQFVDTINRMVCHGCRIGFEVEIFKKLNPSAAIWGTDIYARAYQHRHGRRLVREMFREMDFDTVPPEWIGYFDVVYSNSIDHSRNPIITLLAWKSELKDGGLIYSAFHWGSDGNKADCFSLSRDASLVLEGVPNYSIEIAEIAKQIGMNMVYVSNPYTVNEGKGWSADAIFRKE